MALASLFSGYPGLQAGELTANTYLSVIDDCPAESVEAAAIEFARGEIDGRDNRFCPTSAEFAQRCRLWASAQRQARNIGKTPKLIPYPIGSLPPPGTKPLGPIEIDGKPVERVSNVVHLPTKKWDVG